MFHQIKKKFEILKKYENLEKEFDSLSKDYQILKEIKEKKSETIDLMKKEATQASIIIKLISQIGILGGSRRIGMNDSLADYDFFFLKEEEFIFATELVNKFYPPEIEGYYEEIHVPIRYMYSEKRRVWRTTKYNPRLDLNLVKKILTNEEILKLHLIKHTAKIQDHIEKIKNWEEMVYKNGIAKFLSKDQRDRYIIYLSDNKKI